MVPRVTLRSRPDAKLVHRVVDPAAKSQIARSRPQADSCEG